ncbi:MAG: hypothetical protein HY544_05800 [Candidatus Diapherotrites archaeon]|uniref:Uncharacterized protein n=1 Tax=Candidatus Iainarchaeum sp. TaxID=3101447 RepID=A0A8T3YKD0_9ARCH|nr:hypothetical protein [Candidatus Diapherotrites archaeon]
MQALGFTHPLSKGQRIAVRRQIARHHAELSDRPFIEQRRRKGQERAEQRMEAQLGAQRARSEDNRQKSAREKVFGLAAKQREWEAKERALKRASDYELADMLVQTQSFDPNTQAGRAARKLVGDYYESSYFSDNQRELAIECLKAHFMKT